MDRDDFLRPATLEDELRFREIIAECIENPDALFGVRDIQCAARYVSLLNKKIDDLRETVRRIIQSN